MKEKTSTIKTTNDAYRILKEHGFDRNDFITKQEGYRFAFDKEKNRFIYKKDEYFYIDPVSYSGSDYKTTLFGASTSGNGLIGFETYTGSTTYEYKYLVKSTNEVIN